MLTTLRYSTYATIASTLGTVGTYAFRCNSLHDPDFTSAGHQPLYHDTFASLYDQYSVTRSRIRVTFINVSATASGIVGLVVDDDQTSSTSINVLTEQTHSQSSYITPLSGSKSSITFEHHWSCKDYLKIDPYKSQTYKTAFGSNPTEASYWHLYYASALAGASDVIQFKIDIEYEVLLTELATPTAS